MVICMISLILFNSVCALTLFSCYAAFALFTGGHFDLAVGIKTENYNSFSKFL